MRHISHQRCEVDSRYHRRRWRSDPCLAAGLSAWSGLGRFRPDQQHHWRRNLIRVAAAWDPARVLPLWGTFTSALGLALDMRVDVTVTEGPDSIAQTD